MQSNAVHSINPAIAGPARSQVVPKINIDNIKNPITSSLGLFSVTRDVIGAHNESTISQTDKTSAQSTSSSPSSQTPLAQPPPMPYLLLSPISYALPPPGVAAPGVVALHGLAASTALDEIHETLDAQAALLSARRFSRIIRKYVCQRINDTRDGPSSAVHRCFVYHPDDNWYPDFYTRVEPREGLERLAGVSHSLPHFCYFMMHVGAFLRRERPRRRYVFHLLMPVSRGCILRRS